LERGGSSVVGRGLAEQQRCYHQHSNGGGSRVVGRGLQTTTNNAPTVKPGAANAVVSS